jgi:hypothetical protein
MPALIDRTRKHGRRIAGLATYVAALAAASAVNASGPIRVDRLDAREGGKMGRSPDRLLSIAPLTSTNPNPKVLPPGSNPYGASYGEWGARWWQWALSGPLATNPILDPDGSYCDLAQSGPVWHLAGNFGGTTERACTVPAGKAVFFPIVNFYANYPCPPEFGFEPAPGQTLEEFLREFAGSVIDGAINMAVEVDGTSLTDLTEYRGTSDLFLLDIHPEWAALDPCVTGEPQPAVTDGYWLMLAPLAPGGHTLHFHAELPSFGFVLDVTYDLTVIGGGGRATIQADGEERSWSLIKSLYR